MNRLLKFLAIAGILFWSAHMLYPILTGKALDSQAGASKLMEAKPAKAEHSLQVLFIGNSYTFYNDMPRQLVEIARSDTQNRTYFMVKSVTRGGIGLKELWDIAEARNALSERKWDYVVLQEQSFWAIFPDSVITTTKVARLWDQEIKKTGARTLLFVTWARKPGSHWYTDGKTAFLKSPEYMQQRFTTETNELAKRIGATPIPVGGYWAYANSAFPDIDLYSGDGTHPAAAGSYLSALVFYRYLAQHPLDNVTYTPPGLSPENAKKLREIVR